MKRQVSLEEISDGRLYTKNDMVRAGCNDCKGCSSCCSGMGESVILDPLDIFRMTTELGTSFEQLMADKLELNVVDGIILPNLKMRNGTETCGFLNEQGRCSIHPQRPGICRLFPLGRYYEQEEASVAASEDKGGRKTEKKKRGFRYFLQIHECPAANKTKVKIEKWMDMPNLTRYEQFVSDWHYFLEDVQERLAAEQDEVTVKNANLFLLKLFYIKAYEPCDFYGQFEDRLEQAKDVLFG